MKPIVYVAISGGVDSSVAAALLCERGFEVRGVFMRYWGDVDDLVPRGEEFTNCCNIEAMNDAQAVCDRLGIPLEIMDLREKFRDDVVRHFVREYERGTTPNPCVECNRSIKFELIERILNEASEGERENIFFATGHYILLKREQGTGSREQHRLFAAVDARKDQSYFLYTLTQEKLRRLLFPLGEHTKEEVRTLARSFNLPVADKLESQEVCFVKGNVNAFLRSRIVKPQKGMIVATTGEVLGEHEGLAFYTLGQREGLKLGGGGPYYIAAKQAETNILVVARGAEDPALSQTTATLTNMNWISGQAPAEPIRVIAKPRYRHPGSWARIYLSNVHGQMSSVRCVFDAAERSLTAGQSVVFYTPTSKGMELLGGSIIDK